MILRSRLACLAIVAMTCAPLQASFLNSIGLRNTGVNVGTGVNAGRDMSYKVSFHASDASLAVAGLGTASQAFVRTGTTFPLPPGGPWLANDAESSWISPDLANTNAVGYYAYETSFNLTGYIPSQVTLSFNFTADNWIVDTLLNGVSTGIDYTADPNDGQLYKKFSDIEGIGLGSNFVAGVNKLVFVTKNIPGGGNNPNGFRVKFSSASGGAVIPEPASALLFVLGAPVVGLFVRRRTV